MKNVFLFLVLFFCVSIGYSQQYPVNQTLGSPTTLVTSRGGFKADSSFILPAYSDTNKANANPYVKNYAGSLIKVGNTIYVRSTDLSQWILVGSGGGTTPNLQQVLDVGNTAINTLTIRNVGNTDSIKLQSNKLLIESAGAYKGEYFGNGFQSTYKPTGNFYKIVGFNPNHYNNQTLLIPQTGGVLVTRVNGTLADSSGNVTIASGSGTVTSISQGYGITNSTNPITTTGTIKIDTATLSSKYLRLADTSQMLSSYSARINGKLNISDTASMLSPYSRTNAVNASLAAKLNISDTSSMLTNYFNKVNYGLSNSGQTISVDSATLSNKYLRIVDTTNKFVNRITRTAGKDSIIYFVGGNRFAIKDSVGSGGGGSVTSVGLTMPSAFSVTNSPITTSGTIAVTGAGTVSQYVRGDGTLANFPASTGGGASVSYYLNGSVSQGTIGGNAYKQINTVPVIGTGTDFTINANGYIAQFITDVADPNKLLIPAGNWNFETYFSASSGGGSPSFYIELYKYDGATFTLIASSSAAPEVITGGTSIDLYFTALAVPSTTLLATDRLAVRFYVTHSGRTITMHTENSHLSQIITTFSTGLTALNGLTAQVQNLATGTSGTDFGISSSTATHTFNLPTASATNRGALSTTDWSAFNSKLGASDTVSLSNRINLKLNIADTASMLSSYSTRINGKLNIADTSALQRKSIPAYTILANNTSATANVTAQQFRDTSGVYSGTITWTGTTAPSGATTHTYRLTQVGKCVTLHIALVFAVNGAGLTAVQMTLPSGAPTPAQPTGLTGALANMYPINGQITNVLNAIIASQSRGYLRNNTAGNGFEIILNFQTSALGQVGVIAQYWTN